jgi:hypothetical protein
MGKVYRSAQGKMVDIDKLRLANENSIAVGNAKVNARGDKLGPGGVVIQSRNQAMDQQYKKIHTPMASMPVVPDADPISNIDLEEDRNFDQMDVGTVNETPVNEVPVERAAQKPLRGSLADSVAKTVTVEQGIPPTAKPRGPQRI